MTEIVKQDPPPASEQKYFGRLKARDPRDKGYRIQLVESPRVYRYWTLPIVLDQGPTPKCVAYSSCGWLLAGPVRNTDPFITPERIESYADALYHDCQKNDEWDGEDYEGTSVRAAFKVFKQRGFVSMYNWATTAEIAANHVLETGPVVMGTNWLEGMDKPVNGFIRATGGVLGGHAWCLIGFNRNKVCPDGSKGAFRMQNSWGSGWGEKGRAWISSRDIDSLIQADGEAAAAIEVDLDVVRRHLAHHT